MAIFDFLSILLVTTIWGLNFAISKIGMDQIPPLFLSAARFSIVALAIFFVPKPKVHWHIYVGIGIFIGVIKFSLLFIAIDIGMGAGLASVVVQGQVFFTIILSFLLLKERIKTYQLIGLLVGFFGLAIMGFDEGRDFNLVGFFLVVLAALCWGIANMFFRKTGGSDALPVIVWASAIAVIPIWTLSFVIEGSDLILQTIYNIDHVGILIITYIALASTLYCYSTWGKLLSKYKAAVVTPFALLIPVSGLLGGIILTGESLTLTAMFGISTIMLGLCISVFGDKVQKLFSKSAS